VKLTVMSKGNRGLSHLREASDTHLNLVGRVLKTQIKLFVSRLTC